MSEQVASTIISIGIDDSGVEAGAKRVERSIATLGKNVADSAQAAGNSIASLGDGADKASATIDRETKKIEAQLQRVLLVTTAGTKGTSEYYAALANAKGANLATLKPYLDQLDQVNQKTRVAADANQRLADSTRFLDSLKNQSESLGKTASQMATLRAAELGVADAAAPMIAKMAAAEQGLGKVGMSAAATAAAMRNVPAQFTDIVVSLQSGQKPLTVLLQQGGQLKDMFGGVGNATEALGTYVVGLINPLTLAATAVAGLGYAYNEGSKESLAFNRALILTGNSAGTTSDKLQSMSKAIAASSDFTRGAAAGALAGMTASGRIASGNLQDFSRVALQMEKTIGKSISETASDLSELGRSPLEASEKLNEKYRYLTATVYQQIKALQEQGKASDAAKLAQETYVNSFDTKTKQLKDNLGIIEKGWNAVAKAAKSGWDAILSVGRPETKTDETDRLKVILANKEAYQEQKRAAGNTDNDIYRKTDAEIAAIKQILSLRSEDNRLESRSAAAAADSVEREEARVKWIKEGNQYLTKRQQMELEVTRTKNEGKAAGVDDAEIDKRVNDVKRKYADLSNSSIAALEAGRKIEKEIMVGQLSDLEAKHSMMLVSDTDYIMQKRDLQLKDLEQEKKLVEKQAQLANGKEDKSERERYLGDLKVFGERKINIVRDAQNAIDQYSFASSKAIGEQSAKWISATTSEQRLLDEEIALFGKSAEARKIESAQIKVDAEVREFLAAEKKKNHNLLPDEIALILLEANARKTNISAIEGERQAIAGAEQLRQENLKFGAEAILDEKERAKVLLGINADMWRERIRLAGDGTEGQKELQTQFDQWYKNQSIKPALDEQKAMWKSIDDAAHDAFINIFNGGKNAFDRLKDSLKAGLLDLLYQMTVKKWIISIGASVTGSLVSGAAGAATAAGAAGAGTSLASLVGTGANVISAAGTMLGTSAVAAFGQGLSVAMGTASADAAYMLSYAQLTGNVSMGAQLGTAVGSGVSSIGSAIAAIPGWGWAAMAAAAVAVLGQGKDRQLTGVGLSGQLGTQNITRDVSWTKDGGWFNSNTAGTWKYNLANSSTVVDGRNYTDSASMTSDQALLKDITGKYDAMKVAASDYAKALGLNADYLTARTQSFSTNLGTTAEEMQKNLADLFKNVGNDISKELLNLSPGLSALSKEGEAASDTLARLAGDVRAADTLFAALGKSLPTGDAATAAAKASLVEMGGGLEKFNQGASYFIQNFLTEAEQMAPVIKSVTDKMSGLGLAGVTTVEQFKNTVKGLDLTTDAGAKLYTSLIEISPAFKTVADYTLKLGEATSTATAQIDNALKSLNDSVQNEIDSLIKSTQTLAQQRAAERVGKDPSTIALLDKRDALQDKIKAEQDAEAKKQELLALTKTRTDLEIGLMEAMGNAEGALAARRKETLEATTDAISKELLLKTFAAQDAAKADQDLKTKADAAKAEAAAIASAAAAAKQEYDRQVAADKQAYDQNISTLRGKLQSAYNAEAASLQEVISKHQAYADAAKQAAAALTLGDVSPLNDRQKYSLLQSQLPDIIKQANLSNPDAIGQLQQFAELSKLTNNFDQYTSDLGLVNSTLVNTGNTAQTQATIAKNSLDMMKKEVDVLLGVETGVGTVAEAIAALNLAMSAGLQNVASAAFGQYQANNPSLAKAAIATTTAPTPDQIYGGLAGEGSMQQARAAALKSEADKTAKVQSYMDKMLQADLLAAQNGGVTNQYYMDLNDKYYTQAGFEKFARELGLFADPNLPTLSRLPKFATGGYHLGGLRIVGENGPELEATGPARIYDASQTARLLASGGASNSEMVAELRAMAATLEGIEANTRATAGHTNRAANTLDDASDGDALLMRAPA